MKNCQGIEIIVIFTYNLKANPMKKKPIYLAVLNFNTVTVNLHCISRIDQERISKAIDEDDDDSIVLEFMREHEHRESECQYMFSDKPIPAFSEGEPIWE
jgi:hypothetical protein